MIAGSLIESPTHRAQGIDEMMVWCELRGLAIEVVRVDALDERAADLDWGHRMNGYFVPRTSPGNLISR
jgi:hypothetical protein